MSVRPDDQAAGLARKTYVAREVRKVAADVFEYVLSDGTPDRMGDVIEPAGWQLANFKRNPIALFGHDTDFIVGQWRNVRVVDDELRGELELLPPTSDRLREVDAAVQAGVLRAVSVGFRPIKAEPLDEDDPFAGTRFLSVELIECSLVAVGANPNALQIAKQLNLSPQTLSLIFGVQAKENHDGRGDLPGVQAETTTTINRKMTPMLTMSQRIENSQARQNELAANLQAHLDGLDDSNVSDAQMETTARLNADLAREKKNLAGLLAAEQNLGQSASNGSAIAVRTTTAFTSARPFAMPKKAVEPLEYLVRAGTARIMAAILGCTTDEARQRFYGDDECTRALTDIVIKTATAPAMTGVTGWAAELVQTVNAALVSPLTANTVFPRLSALGLQLTFGRNGKILVPTRSATPTIAGSFVGEGLPIPVRQGAFTSVTLVPKKLGVITEFSREMDEHSQPAIEPILREAILIDTGLAIDNVLLDTNAATAVRPAGIRNGIAGLTATAGGGFNALVGDIKQLTAALLTSTVGNVRTPAWLLNPIQANSIALTQPTTTGLFPFRDEINAGRLNGQPAIISGSVPAGTVIYIDAADFVVVGGEAPRFMLSDQATLHEEDTTPLPIGTAGAPPTVAAPTRSLFQTDSLALRLILPLNWTMRRPNMVAWVSGVTW